MKNFIFCLLLAFIIVNMSVYGQDESDNSVATPKLNIVIDAKTREAIANGDSEAVIDVLTAANVDANNPTAVSQAVKQIVDLMENSPEGN
ncbi:MAG: hypothetical protein VYE55_01900 [Verrucomicrobiota bacterium]|nr:hypothetical protein [Verrucomicrobiota bacterium]MEC8333228.1 hypothetical protein [Verrucomicrobiota bacterium]